MRKLFFILSLLLAAYLVVVALYFPQKEEAPICRKVDIHLNSDEKSKSLISKEQILQEINEIDSVPIGRIVTSYNTNRVEHALQSKNALVSECNLFLDPMVRYRYELIRSILYFFCRQIKKLTLLQPS